MHQTIIFILDEPLLVPDTQLSRYDSLALSDRAKRTKLIAQYRPDVTWQQSGSQYYSYIRVQKIYTLKINGDVHEISESTIPSSPTSYIQPATPLAQLVQDADQHMLAMRKIVQ